MPGVDRDRILVVEDDELVRSFLTHALAGDDSDVDGCATGSEALHLVARRTYSVILLDGLLPDIHGLDLARSLIRGDGARAGICFVSGTLRQPWAMVAGVSALPKPLRVRELVDSVARLRAWHASAADPQSRRLAAVDSLAAGLLVT